MHFNYDHSISLSNRAVMRQDLFCELKSFKRKRSVVCVLCNKAHTVMNKDLSAHNSCQAFVPTKESSHVEHPVILSILKCKQEQNAL